MNLAILDTEMGKRLRLFPTNDEYLSTACLYIERVAFVTEALNNLLTVEFRAETSA